MTDLTTIFGSEIKVYGQPADIARQFAGYAGAHGLTAMHLGSRGYSLMVTGRLRAYGATYAIARASLLNGIVAIEDWLFAAAEDYSFFNDVYYGVVWNRFQLIPDASGKAFHWNPAGEVFADFRCTGRGLV